MAKEPVFYSFHYDNDVNRVQLIRNMGVIDGEEPVKPNVWESIKKQGNAAIEKWIDDNMRYKTCVVVLIGSQTAQRPWVKHEIKRAWEMKKGLFGIHIHNLRCMNSGFCTKGDNPFYAWNIGNTPMANFITVYDPPAGDAYNHINRNLSAWASTAISQAKAR
jgi:hypothetical protein